MLSRPGGGYNPSPAGGPRKHASRRGRHAFAARRREKSFSSFQAAKAWHPTPSTTYVKLEKRCLVWERGILAVRAKRKRPSHPTQLPLPRVWRTKQHHLTRQIDLTQR